jgi:hypothetical protein
VGGLGRGGVPLEVPPVHGGRPRAGPATNQKRKRMTGGGAGGDEKRKRIVGAGVGVVAGAAAIFGIAAVRVRGVFGVWVCVEGVWACVWEGVNLVGVVRHCFVLEGAEDGQRGRERERGGG